MVRKNQSVLVRVPASTSNLGSGFDTLGLAVDLHNTICVTTSSRQNATIVSHISSEDRPAAEKMVRTAAEEFFNHAKTNPFGFEVSLTGNMPVARGLGYSATVRLGVVAALNQLAGTRWDRQRFLELVTLLEGHPDNASPAIFGGFTVSGKVGQTVRCTRFPVSPKLRLVSLIPELKVSTEKARRVLPESFPKPDAAHGLNRAALITAAFASQKYDALRGLFDDRIHQPYREPLIPQLTQVIRAGETAGAIGGFLSGSGSAIICLTLEQEQQVALAMRREFPNSEVKILSADNKGFRIE